jgi:hypothetical protein
VAGKLTLFLLRRVWLLTEFSYVHDVMDGAVFKGSTSVWKESEISVR